jgi:AraC-like DNA-binding protein
MGPAPNNNWFAALNDAEIGPALGLMHIKPEEPWTVASLAEHAAMSRSAFAARFMAVVGQSPLKYLTDCRMRKARDLLRDGRLGLKAISAKVGYTTESAFSNAFKRHIGQSPGAFRNSGR